MFKSVRPSFPAPIILFKYIIIVLCSRLDERYILIGSSDRKIYGLPYSDSPVPIRYAENMGYSWMDIEVTNDDDGQLNTSRIESREARMIQFQYTNTTHKHTGNPNPSHTHADH